MSLKITKSYLKNAKWETKKVILGTTDAGKKLWEKRLVHRPGKQFVMNYRKIKFYGSENDMIQKVPARRKELLKDLKKKVPDYAPLLALVYRYTFHSSHN